MRDVDGGKRRSPAKILGRVLRLRCPVCGAASVFERPFRVRHHCPACRALFKREEGFFVGAIAINLVATEGFTILLCFVGLLFFEFRSLFTALFATALLLPVLFYHHAWAVWLGFDHFIETLPRYDGGGRAGGNGDWGRMRNRQD
jgi:uncharacterized protein (DUF983 family)